MNSIFKHNDLQSFLLRYVEDQKVRNPKWTLGMWAKKLKLSNAASITRVISGERTVGDRLFKSLTREFNLNGLEREYFRYLVVKNCAKTDPVFREMVNDCHWVRPELRKTVDSNHLQALGSPLLKIDSGRSVTLVGFANLHATARRIWRDGVSPIPINDKALVLVHFCSFEKTNVGQFLQFYLSIYSCPPELSIDQSGFLYHSLYCDNPALSSIGRFVWGNDYLQGKIIFARDRFELEVDRKILARLEFKSDSKGDHANEDVQTWGFAKSFGALTRAPIKVQSSLRKIPFDDSLHRFETTPGSSLHDLLSELKFEPVQLEIRDDLRCYVWPAFATKYN